MENKEYIEQTRRTRAEPKINLTGEIFTNGQQVLRQAVDVIYAGVVADSIKRALFYGDPKVGERVEAARVRMIDIYKAIQAKPELVIPEDKINLLHAIVGVASEVGEMMEELINSIIEDRPVDQVNMKEELGDNQWYIAMALDSIEETFESVHLSNIAKLERRYPEKFTQEDALNRDVGAERVVLEQ